MGCYPHERHFKFIRAMEKSGLIVSGTNHRQWARELWQPSAK